MQRLGRPEPLRQDFGEPASFYRSPLLEHCIRAHLEIYEIIGPRIEQGVLEWASHAET